MAQKRSRSGSSGSTRSRRSRTASGSSSRRAKSAAGRSGARSAQARGTTRSAGSRSTAAQRRTGGRSKTAGQGSGRSGSSRARAGSGTRRGGEPSAIALLKRDHREVAQRLEQFKSGSSGSKRELAEQICRMLTVHAQLEEELVYPQAHEALGDQGKLITEARVEHATLKDLIGQLESMDGMDELFEAKMQVLGEYVQHHVREEENEVFPRLQRSGIDLEGIGERIAARKQELMGGAGSRAEAEDEEEASPRSARGRSGARGGPRPALLHAGKR